MPQPLIASPNVPSKFQTSFGPPYPLTNDPFFLQKFVKAGGKSDTLIKELIAGIVELAHISEKSAPDFISYKQTADTKKLNSILLPNMIRQTSIIADRAGPDDESLVATMLALQGGLGCLLVNLTQGKNDKSELIDKSVEDVVSAWATLKKKAQAAQA